jgi:hypothetical protein
MFLLSNIDHEMRDRLLDNDSAARIIGHTFDIVADRG